MSFSRRNLLKGAAAVTAFGIIGLKRKSAYADSPVGKKKLLVIDLNGGCRNLAAFNASQNTDLNPAGVYTAQPTGSMSLGNMLFSARDQVVNRNSTAWGQTIPGFESIAPLCAVVGAVEHSKSYMQGDHTIAGLIMGTGFPDRPDFPGLLTLVGRYASPGGAPGCVISPGTVTGSMAMGQGEWLAFQPLPLAFNAIPTAGSGVITATDAEDAFDKRARETRRGLVRNRLDTIIGYKSAMRKYGQLFLKPALNFADTANFQATLGVAGSPTNLQLLQAMGNKTADGDPGHPDGANAALAIRMLEAGAPYVGLGISGENSFDLHTDEETMGPPLFSRTAQILAGIHFALTKLNMINDVVVCTTSEFNRTVYAGGYSGARGSDHGDGPLYGSAPTWRYQPSIFFGGGIKPKILHPTDPQTNNPKAGSCSATRLLVTLAELGGVPAEAQPWMQNDDSFFDGPSGLWQLFQ